MANPHERRLLTSAQALRLAGFAALSMLLIAAQGLSLEVHSDSAQDFELAKNCALGPATCMAHHTSVEGLNQGRLLLFILNWLQDVGIEARFHLAVLSIVSASGVGIVGETIARLFERRGAQPGRVRASSLCTVALLSLFLPWMADHPVLWNPTLGTFPLCLWTASVAGLASEREELACAGIAVASALAYHAHIVYLVVWFAALPAVGALTRGWRGPVWALVGVPVLLALFDGPGLLQNRGFVSALPGGAALFVASPAIVLAGGVALRRPLRSARDRLDTLAPWVAVSACGLACALALAMVVVVLDRPFEPRYFAPAAPALAMVACAWIAYGLWGLHRFVPPVVTAGVVVVFHRSLDPPLTVADLRAVDAQLGESGPLAANTERIRGFQAGVMTRMMQALERRPPPLRPPDGTVLQVVQVQAGSCPPDALGWACIEPAPGQILAWKEDRQPWFSPTHFEMADGTGEPPRFEPVEVDPAQPYIGPDSFGDTAVLVQRIGYRAHRGPRLVLLESGWRLVEASGGLARPIGRFGDAQWVRVEAREGAEGEIVIEYPDPPHAVPRRPSVGLELDEREFAALFPEDATAAGQRSVD